MMSLSNAYETNPIHKAKSRSGWNFSKERNFSESWISVESLIMSQLLGLGFYRMVHRIQLNSCLFPGRLLEVLELETWFLTELVLQGHTSLSHERSDNPRNPGAKHLQRDTERAPIHKATGKAPKEQTSFQNSMCHSLKNKHKSKMREMWKNEEELGQLVAIVA